jgi:hypothetical protein
LRGSDERTGSLFSYVDLEARVCKDHALRSIRLIVNETLSAMERDFAALYAGIGRPSVAPEMLLRAMLLQVRWPLCIGTRTAPQSRSVDSAIIRTAEAGSAVADDNLKLYVDATRPATLNDGVGSQTDFATLEAPRWFGAHCPLT